MATNFGDFIQMIGVLGGLKSEKQRLALQERQLTQQAEQFADANNRNEFKQALELVGKYGIDAAGALIPTLGEQHRAPFQQFLAKAVETKEVQQNRGMAAGYGSMTPEQQQAANQEAYTANTSGLNRGQVGASGYVGQLAAGAPAPTPEQSGRWAERTGSGMTPFGAAQDQSAVDQGIAPQAARIAAGVQMDAGQAAANTLGNRNAASSEELIKAQVAESAWRLAREKALGEIKLTMDGGGEINPDQAKLLLETMGEARHWAVMAQDPTTPAETRRWLRTQLNTLAAISGVPSLGVDEDELNPMSGIGRTLRGGNPPVPISPAPIAPALAPYQSMPTTGLPAGNVFANPNATSIPWMRR